MMTTPINLIISEKSDEDKLQIALAEQIYKDKRKAILESDEFGWEEKRTLVLVLDAMNKGLL